MLLYIYERQQCGHVVTFLDLPWTPDHTGNGRETRDTTQNALDIENMIQIGYLLEDNSLFY